MALRLVLMSALALAWAGLPSLRPPVANCPPQRPAPRQKAIRVTLRDRQRFLRQVHLAAGAIPGSGPGALHLPGRTTAEGDRDVAPPPPDRLYLFMSLQR
jgi:hypothetical protein